MSGTFGVIAFIGVLGTAMIIINSFAESAKKAREEQEKLSLMSPDEKQDYLEQKAKERAESLDKMQRIGCDPNRMCPYCQVWGKVHTMDITQKKGISGGKATAALLTGGISLLAVGLSGKETSTKAHCRHCNNTWYC